jgi:DNA-binding response OmpR family regulator
MQTAHDQVEDLLEKMRVRARHPEVDRLSAQVSLLCRGYMEPVMADPLPGVRLTPNEGKLFALLKARLGQAVARGALLDAASFHHGWDREPGIKIVDVYICRLRRKLAGSQYTIETVWGRGYRLVDAGGGVGMDGRVKPAHGG